MLNTGSYFGLKNVLLGALLVVCLIGFVSCFKSGSAKPNPTVQSTTPEGEVTDVDPVSPNITATFSIDMDASTINGDTFTLVDAGGNPVEGTVESGALPSAMVSGKADGADSGIRVATFTPSAALSGSSEYTATLTTGIKSSDGVALSNDIAWSFTTASTLVSIVAASNKTTCANKEDGSLYCWGLNEYGQAGNSTTTTPEKTPKAVSGAAKDWTVLSSSSSGKHFCGIKSPGTLWCWGLNEHGQLGLGEDGLPRYVPTKVGADEDWVSVSCGYAHTCAIKSTGSLWCWGYNKYGQLGNGENENSWTPSQVGAEVDWGVVSPGGLHTCATKTGNSLYCWGLNIYGQLGTDSLEDKNEPQKVAGDDWASVGLGEEHSCAIKQNSLIYCWGRNAGGRLGIGSLDDKKVPTAVIDLPQGASHVAAGSEHTCAIAAVLGEIYCWGLNTYGQLGRDDIPLGSDRPVEIEGDGWSKLVSGYEHNCARKADGALSCWGRNDSGQIGDDTLDDKSLPTGISGF